MTDILGIGITSETKLRKALDHIPAMALKHTFNFIEFDGSLGVEVCRLTMVDYAYRIITPAMKFQWSVGTIDFVYRAVLDVALLGGYLVE